MKDVMAILELSAKSLATSAIRRMFSTRASGLKPRSLLRPKRMLSPTLLFLKKRKSYYLIFFMKNINHNVV